MTLHENQYSTTSQQISDSNLIYFYIFLLFDKLIKYNIAWKIVLGHWNAKLLYILVCFGGFIQDNPCVL